MATYPCGCAEELAAMLEHQALDFDYVRACHCLAYQESERCDCDFCKRAIAARVTARGGEGES